MQEQVRVYFGKRLVTGNHILQESPKENENSIWSDPV